MRVIKKNSGKKIEILISKIKSIKEKIKQKYI